MKRRRMMWPAGTTLHANDSLPMRESSSRFVHFLRCTNDCNSSNINDLRSLRYTGCHGICVETIPKKMIWVEGGTTFSALIGALIR